MRDEEVGEIWSEIEEHSGQDYRVHVKKLIRKLVEERAQVKWRCGMPKKDCDASALRDFHIDPATWAEGG